MASAAFWTDERLSEAFDLHLEFDTLEALAEELTNRWNYPVTTPSIRNALKKGYPEHGFRATVGRNKRLRELKARQQKAKEALGSARTAIAEIESTLEPEKHRVDYRDYSSADLSRKHIIPADPKERGDLVYELNEGRATVVAIWPDAHVPEHHAPTMEACMLFVEAIKPDIVVDLGDFLNLDSLTRHEKSELGGERLEYVFRVGAAILKDYGQRLDAVGVRKRAFVTGNHELRLHRYLLSEAPELYTTFPTVQEALLLSQSGWDFVSYGGCVRVGSVAITHGEKYNKHVADTIVTEQGNQVFGHTHRTQLIIKNTRPGHPEMAMTPGCRAKLNQKYEYHKPNDHVHGMGLVVVQPNGAISMHPILMHSGVLRWPIPGGKTLVCDGNLKRTYEE